MLYRIQAKPVEATLQIFYRRLTDGTIENQEPDGKEIVASMRRATIENGLVEWRETCYCDPPLRHERATVYDQFFADMRILPADTKPQQNGTGFWGYLETGIPSTPVSQESSFSGAMERALGRNTV